MADHADNPPAAATSPIEARLDNAVIAVMVRCRGCDYNLHSLPATELCPECGLPIPQTLQALVDPAASRLPALSDPRRVGTGILVLTVSALAIALLVLATPVLTRFGWDRWIDPRDLRLAALVAVLAGLVSVQLLRPPRGRSRGGSIRRDVWLLDGALGAWAVLLLIMLIARTDSSGPGLVRPGRAIR